MDLHEYPFLWEEVVGVRRSELLHQIVLVGGLGGLGRWPPKLGRGHSVQCPRRLLLLTGEGTFPLGSCRYAGWGVGTGSRRGSQSLGGCRSSLPLHHRRQAVVTGSGLGCGGAGSSEVLK